MNQTKSFLAFYVLLNIKSMVQSKVGRFWLTGMGPENAFLVYILPNNYTPPRGRAPSFPNNR